MVGSEAPSSGFLCCELQSYRNLWEEVAHLSCWPLPSPQGPPVLPTFQRAVFMEQSVTSLHDLFQEKQCHDFQSHQVSRGEGTWLSVRLPLPLLALQVSEA